MLGANVLADLEATTLPPQLQTSTPWGTETLLKQLQSPQITISDLKRVQTPLLALRHPSAAANLVLLQSELSKQIKPHCSTLDETRKTEFSDTRIQESVTQILWDPKSMLAPLNTRSTFLTGLLNWKTVVVPFFSVIMPIIAVIVPFFVLRFLHGSESVSVDQYIGHVKRTLLSQITIPSILRAKHDGDVFGKITETLVLLLTIGTFAMGLWNQIQSALHLRTIAADLKARGNALREIVASSQRILKLLEDLPPLPRKGLQRCIDQGHQSLAPLESFAGGLAGFGQVWNTPILFEPLKSWIGQLDAQVTLATQESICFPHFRQGALTLQKFYHPCLSPEKRILNDADFSADGKGHVLLTGPNRGGKSTFCKSLGLSILWAQTWGIAWAASMTFEPFQRLETALSPADILGKMSLFETEIEFAKQVLQQSETGQRMFVMMDEIFHSTNAQDGIAASRIFLKRLYGCGTTMSLISTHYRDLVSEFKEAAAWQMVAKDREDGSLEYTYVCAAGVSEKSSVMEILKERGLCPA